MKILIKTIKGETFNVEVEPENTVGVEIVKLVDQRTEGENSGSEGHWRRLPKTDFEGAADNWR